jgi:hypothetical protein
MKSAARPNAAQLFCFLRRHDFRRTPTRSLDTPFQGLRNRTASPFPATDGERNVDLGLNSAESVLRQLWQQRWDVRDNSALRRLGAVRRALLFDPSVDDLLLELFLAQRVSFNPVLIRGTGIDALQLVEVAMAQCRISRNLGEGLLS